MPQQVISGVHPPDVMAGTKGGSAYAVWVSRFELDTDRLNEFQRWAVPAAREMERHAPAGVRHVGLHTVLCEDGYEVWDLWAFESEQALSSWNLLLQNDDRFVALRDESLTFAAAGSPVQRRILREVSQRPLLGLTKFGVNI